MGGEGVVVQDCLSLSVCLTGKLHPGYLNENRGLNTSWTEKRGGKTLCKSAHSVIIVFTNHMEHFIYNYVHGSKQRIWFLNLSNLTAARLN